jgi:hypothetical protein
VAVATVFVVAAVVVVR